MKTKQMWMAMCLCCTMFLSSFAYAGGGDKTEESKFSFDQLRKEVKRMVKPLMLKAKSNEKMWVVFTIDENRQLHLLDYSAELKPLSEELNAAINNKLISAGSFYSDTPYTMWVNVKTL